MAIIESKETESNNVSGFNKGIEASAMSMMLDNLQIFMYQKPVQSTVRECTSNALDSLKEKKVAMEIITGQATVEDYFVDKEGDIYKDSRFDHAYYDLKWLSPDNTVYLNYYNSTDSLSRDQFVIEDTGVGLGGIRLEKYFSLGYSSKRLTSQTLGAFGLGNKSPLATGVDSYRIVSRYNGREFCFDIFSHKVDCVYSKWNEDGSDNEFITFSNGFKAFYKKTTEKNGVKLLIDVKKHHKHQYVEAVKGQLMYFKDNIVFREHYEGQAPKNIDFKSKILFESEDIIVSDSNYFSRPHFVLKNVSYGAVDFKELELENRHGTIGIKINMEEVDVSPSRENIIYNQRTREVIIRKYNSITGTVTNMINDSLKTEDLVDWLRACNTIFYGSQLGGTDEVLFKLSGMIDKHSLELKHPVKKDVQYFSAMDSFLAKGLSAESVFYVNDYDYKKRSNIHKVKRDKAVNTAVFNDPIFLQFNGGTARVTKYLLSKHPKFCVIKPEFKDAKMNDILREFVYKRVDKDAAIKLADAALKEIYAGEVAKSIDYKRAFEKTIKQLADFLESKHVAISDETIVPEDFKTTGDDDDEVTAVKTQDAVDYQEILKARKASGKFILGKVGDRSTGYTEKFVFGNNEVDNSLFKDDDTIVYGYTKDTESLMFLARLASAKYGTTLENGINIFGWTTELKVAKIAQNNKKYLIDRTYVEDYFLTYDKKVMTTSDLLKKYFTTKYIRQSLVESAFLANFTIFDSGLATTYTDLVNLSRGGTTIPLPQTKEVGILESAIKFQIFKWENEGADAELIDKRGTELLGEDILDSIDTIDIIEKDVYEKVKWINAFSEVYGGMLNQIDALKRANSKISDGLERDIKAFIALKKDELEMDYPTLTY